jgi:hypothetical protein
LIQEKKTPPSSCEFQDNGASKTWKKKKAVIIYLDKEKGKEK